MYKLAEDEEKQITILREKNLKPKQYINNNAWLIATILKKMYTDTNYIQLPNEQFFIYL